MPSKTSERNATTTQNAKPAAKGPFSAMMSIGAASMNRSNVRATGKYLFKTLAGKVEILNRLAEVLSGFTRP